MGISGTNNRFFGDVRKAYEGLLGRRVPFAAIGLKIPDQVQHRGKIGKIIQNTFRETDKIFPGSDNAYAILMHNTPLKGAISASARLVSKLRQLTASARISAQDHIPCPSLHIVGSLGAGPEVQAARLDLTQKGWAGSGPEEGTGTSAELRSYMKCARLANGKCMTNQYVNLKI